MSRVCRVVCLMLAFSVVYTTVAELPEACAQRRRNRNNNNRRNRGRSTKAQQQKLQQQIARARASSDVALRRAAAANAKNAAAKQQVETFLSHIRSLENQLDNSSASLRNLQEAIEADQGEGTDLQAKYDELTTAQQQFDAAKKRLFESDDYKAAYQRAAASSNRATELPRLRREAIENDQDYRDAAAELSYAEEQLEQVRMKLYEEDPDWKTATSSNRTARAELAKARQSFKNGLLSKASSGANLRDAMKIAGRAADFIERSEASLAKLKAKERSRSRSRSSGRNR